MLEKERRAYFDNQNNWKPHLEDKDFQVLELKYKRLNFYKLQARTSSPNYMARRLPDGTYPIRTSWEDKGIFLRLEGEAELRDSSVTDARNWMRNIDKEEKQRNE